jgi:hypothetical protein|tara:strand:- start:713 stop:1090 length:378 start_codon:yes stop_codon:yes gene_type:complete
LTEGVVSFQSRFDVAQLKRLDSWITWGVVGAAIGLALGVNQISVILVAVGLGLFLVYVHLHGPAIDGSPDDQIEVEPGDEDDAPPTSLLAPKSEGTLFAAGGVFMMAWLVGFVVRGLIFGDSSPG